MNGRVWVKSKEPKHVIATVRCIERVDPEGENLVVVVHGRRSRTFDGFPSRSRSYRFVVAGDGAAFLPLGSLLPLVFPVAKFLRVRRRFVSLLDGWDYDGSGFVIVLRCGGFLAFPHEFKGPLICCTACREHPIVVCDLKLPATNTLVFKIVLETSDNVSTTVRRSFC